MWLLTQTSLSEHGFPLKMLICPLLREAEIELTVITWPHLCGGHINTGWWFRQIVNPLLNLAHSETDSSKSGWLV